MSHGTTMSNTSSRRGPRRGLTVKRWIVILVLYCIEAGLVVGAVAWWTSPSPAATPALRPGRGLPIQTHSMPLPRQ